MHIAFKLIEFRRTSSGFGGTLYTISFEDQSEYEILRFFSDIGVNKYKHDLGWLKHRLNRYTDDTGFHGSYFNHNVDKYDSPLCRLAQTRLLRLYFIHYGTKIVIAGHGGVKPRGARRYQDVPQLNDAVERLKYVYRRIWERQQIEKNLWIDPLTEDRFKGNLIFEREE